MATRTVKIVDNNSHFDGFDEEIESDGVLTLQNGEIGDYAWNTDGPYGKYISIKLDSHWIVTDGEKKLLDKAKKNGQK